MTNCKVALLWHGDREMRDTVQLDEHPLGAAAAAMRSVGLQPEAAVFNDAFADEVREQLLNVGAVQVWVNPINDLDGTRSVLDALLKDVAGTGVLVSAHPDTIRKMGTKSVLYETRGMAWGSDVRLYKSVEELRLQLPEQLRAGPRVLKQFRGHSGHGIWKVSPTADASIVRVRHARRGNAEQEAPLEQWIASCSSYFTEGPMIDQAFAPRISEGMIRCYLNVDRVGGFGHQALNALVDGADPGPRLYYPPTQPDFQAIKRKMEDSWLPELLKTLGMTLDELPVLWDADFMLGPKTSSGENTYVLCEINVSSVYPYPDSAMLPLAVAIKERLSSEGRW